MFETVARIETETRDGSNGQGSNGRGEFSPALVQSLSIVVLLLTVVLMTTSCGSVAQAASSQNNATPNNLSLYGEVPDGKIHEPYNALFGVGGGAAPYHFSVKTGSLPPGVSMNPATGELSGKPTTAGTFAFEMIVTDSPRLDLGTHSFIVSVGGVTGNGSSTIKVSVSPSVSSLSSTQTQQFTATVSGTSNTGVTWTATTGSVDANGLYTAPTVSAQASAVVTAISAADPAKSASAALTIEPVNSQALNITTSGFPQGQQGDAYDAAFAATGGTTPYSWNISGSTPPGITPNTNGNLAGVPTKTGTFNFTATVTDAKGKTATGSFSIAVTSGGNFDGPAELPRVMVPSAMSDTPAPGSVINVNAGGDLQSALTSAHCGDVIQLQAGATFSGKFHVPAKNCDDNHWIIIRTSSPDSALPAEGQRATPCYAGVASLIGRPAYSCANPQNVMAKVQIQTAGDGPFQFDDGANFYRFIGLEITRPAGAPGPARLMSGKGTIDHLIVDRSWLHGAPQDETHNGVNLSGVTNAAIVDSYLSDFHCIAITGACTDSHAISGGVSDTQDGPFKIQDNFLEASSEAILFGGGAATLTPADIQILNNHFWKPWQWMPGNPNFVGGPDGKPFVVKNHLELKNAVRVLVEANLMENNWGGFSQTGYGILLSPKNQHAQNGTNVCPLCQVTDITIRYVHVSHAGGGMQLATDISGNGQNGAAALAGERWSIHDVVLDDLSTKYAGGGSGFEIMNAWPNNPLNTITINHVTAFPDPSGHLMSVGNLAKSAPMFALVFTNNLVVAAAHPVWSTGGGPSGCAYSDVPITSISKCFTTFTFANNALVGSPTVYPPSTWPSNNLFPPTINDVQFTNFNNGNGGNYELQSVSIYKNRGTDGKDLGADIVGLNAALANVE